MKCWKVLGKLQSSLWVVIFVFSFLDENHIRKIPAGKIPAGIFQDLPNLAWL